MSEGLQGRVAVVTGAARGQGRAFAVRLAQDGADVVALDIADAEQEMGYLRGSSEDLEETAEAVRATGRECTTFAVDNRDREALRKAASEVPRVDVLVANAGITITGELCGDDDVWDRAIGVNLTGAYNTVTAFVPAIVEGGRGGSIVITSSVAGLKGLTMFGAYTASKHGLQGMMKVLAQELAHHRIRVNTINPGPIGTPMTTSNDSLMSLFERDDDLGELFRSTFAPVLPVEGDWITPEEVAETVSFLASDGSKQLTGLAIPVDAGTMVR